MNNRILYIIRGLPGSGKSTLAQEISPYYVEADMWFDLFNNGKFDPKFLTKAHKWCQETVNTYMNACEPVIAVSNTFTQKWEYKPYEEMAKKYGYKVFRMIVENHHGSKSVHDVPENVMDKMRQRFKVEL